MITLERFGPRAETVRLALQAFNIRLSRMLGKEVALSLAAAADEQTLARMQELENEIFAIEDNVYSKADILSCLGEEDSLLLLLHIEGRLEGYAFGYDDDPEHPQVDGTDYFLDSALVSSAYEQLGIGSAAAGVVLLLLYLMGYRDIGLTTEVRDKTGRELVNFYEKLGFSRGVTERHDDYAMKIHLDQALINKLCTQLGISGEALNK